MLVKLKFIELKNFVNYADARFEFSLDKSKPLTVVEGENAVGKTTLLHAISWCLTGEKAKLGADASPDEEQIFTSNWDVAALGTRIDVSVKVGFIVDDGKIHEFVAHRLQKIYLDSARPGVHSADQVQLRLDWQKPEGWQSLASPELMLNHWFPRNLKDLFFMNGDAALAFINSKNASNRRDEVEDAIRQLLKLTLFESAKKHLENAKKKYRTLRVPTGTEAELVKLETKLSQLETEAEGEIGLLEERQEAKKELEKKRDEIKALLDSALDAGAGDGPQLRARRDAIEKLWSAQTKNSIACLEKLRTSTNSSDLLFLLALPTLQNSKKILDELEDKGEIPNTLPILLESALRRKVCICGSDVSEGTLGAIHIHHELEKSREGSETNDTLLSLHQSMAVRTREGIAGLDSWIEKHKDIQTELLTSDAELETLGAELATIESRIGDIPEINVKQLNEDWQYHIKNISELDLLIRDKENDVSDLRKGIETLNSERQQLIRKNEANNEVSWRIDTTEDLEKLFDLVLSSSKGEMVDDLSNLTESYFMEMIALADHEEKGFKPVSGVTIARNYDIIVKSQTNIPIPTGSISGAQQRALTLAIILALQDLSGNKSAKVVDTPLGMTSGALKRSFATTAINLSEQLTLLVTASEIDGLKDLFSEKAGMWYKIGFKKQGFKFPGEIEVERVA